MTGAATDHALQQAAASWVLRLADPNLGEADTAAWLDWCEADPRHRLAFEAMAELWDVSGGLEPIAVDPQPVVANDVGERRMRYWRPLAWAVAAMLVVGLVGLAIQTGLNPFASATPPQMARIETPLGRVRATTLSDGSKVELGGRSALSVRYSADTRMIVADRGEAFFTVAHNVARPFVVQAGPVTITAIGTAFSVQRDDDVVVVTVTEGIVEVRASPPGTGGESATVIRVAAGHRVHIARGELTQSLVPARLDIVTPWREGRLEFKDEPLRLVIARINRYSPRQIVLGDPAIADLRLTTTVYHDRVDDWLDGLTEILPVNVSLPGDDRAIIAPAR
jgi:transmembrane sensor